MKRYLALACVALAAAAASGQNAPAPQTPEPTDIQGIPTSPPPSSRPVIPPPPPAPKVQLNPAENTGGLVPWNNRRLNTDSKVIINYWEVVRDIMKRIEKSPPRPAVSAGVAGDLRPDYPFEEFRNLRGQDLIRAAREGAIAARRGNAGKLSAETDRQVWENTSLALEYFPLVVRDDADIRSLAGIIANREEDPELRRFVLGKLAPKQQDPSLLSMFLDDACARYPVEFGKALDAACGHPMEPSLFQMESMRVRFDRLMRNYQNAFVADEKIAALAKETGTAPAPAALLGENPPVIEHATREKLVGLGAAISSFATLISAHIDVNSASDAGVKTETRRILKQIAAEVLVPDRELILRYLDPSRPIPPAAETLPPMPVMPDTGSDENQMPATPGADLGLPVVPQVSQTDQPPPTPVPLPPGL